MSSKRNTVAATPHPLAAVADELGALEREAAAWRPKLDRIECLRKAIRAHYSDSPASGQYEAAGARFVVSVGVCGVQRVVDTAGLAKAIGAKLFGRVASVTLKALEAHVAPEVATRFITEAQTGTRPLKITERGGLG